MYHKRLFMNQSKCNLPAFGRAALVIFLLSFLAVGAARPTRATIEEEERKNPFTGNAEAINFGRSLFRMNCALCHGIAARGGRGPDLTSGRWTHGDNDAAIFRTITKGVPGTEMTPADMREDEVWMIVAFLRSLTVTSSAPITGNREAGEKLFFSEANCAQCHMVRGKGGRLGPDLSRIGSARSVAHLIESIREPNKEIPRGYETVIAVTKEGKRIVGVRKNEDTFSLQLMDHTEKLHLFLKKDLREVISQPNSLMPGYNERMLDEKKLQDLLAYMISLRGQ
jgi:putative heme-binding domain-containing protein